jgi:hypothetical protein
MKTRRAFLQTFSAGALLALSGCTTLMVWTGMRVRLEKTPVASIQVRLAQGTTMYPGQKLPLIATVTQPDGKQLLTEGAGDGVVLWEDLAITSSIVTVDTKGNVSLPADPTLSDGKVPQIIITVPSHPGIQTALYIPVRYDADFAADFSGAPGRNGWDGRDGAPGMDGSDGSTDPKNPVPGGDGTNGEDGTDGSDGGRGDNAPPVTVRIGLREGPLLQVIVSNALREERFQVDPHGGTLLVKAEGGPGGKGGRGGRGGFGGRGGIGSPNGANGRDGWNGRDGADGPPGNPGPIHVIFDPQAQAYLPAISFFNRYGPKKTGPFPDFTQGPSGPLW